MKDWNLNQLLGLGAAWIVFAIVVNAAFIGGTIWLIVKVLQWTGVI